MLTIGALILFVINESTFTVLAKDSIVYTSAHTVSIKILKTLSLYNIQVGLRWNSPNKCSLNRNNETVRLMEYSLCKRKLKEALHIP